MIVREFYMRRSDGVTLYRTYSSEGKMIVQCETGAVYDEAIDVGNAPFTYREAEPADADRP